MTFRNKRRACPAGPSDAGDSSASGLDSSKSLGDCNIHAFLILVPDFSTAKVLKNKN